MKPFSGLADRFDVVSVGIENVGSVVAGVVMFTDAGRAVIPASTCQSGGVKSVDIRPTSRRKRDVDRRNFSLPFVYPETRISTASEPVSRAAMRGSRWIDRDDQRKSQGGKRCVVEGSRSCPARYREFDVVQQVHRSSFSIEIDVGRVTITARKTSVHTWDAPPSANSSIPLT